MSWLLLSAALAQPVAVSRHALIIGSNDGGEGRTTLRYAHDDARTMASVLTELGGVSDVQMLYDPSPQELDEAFQELTNNLNNGSGRHEVLFYFSGHSNETGLLLGAEQFPYLKLRKQLDELTADVRVAVLDSCASGSMIRAKGGTRVEPFLVAQGGDIDGFAYITSSASDEVAQEAERIGGSYFTHFLTAGLRGAADRSNDGRVTLHEAYQYAFDETLARTEQTQFGPQHAAYDFQLSGTGELVLTDLSRTDSTLIIAAPLAGHLAVRDDRGALVVEVDKTAGAEMMLGFASGSYQTTLLSGSGDRFGSAALQLEQQETFVLTAGDMSWSLTEQTVARGDTPVRKTTQPPLRTGISLSPADLDELAVGLVSVKSQKLNGLQVSLLRNHVLEPSQGAQVSLGSNYSQTGLQGSQVALGSNRSSGDLFGNQLSLGSNNTENMQGLQFAIGTNHARRFEGVQFAIGVNRGEINTKGLQFAIGSNLNNGTMSGAQISTVNRSNEIKGAQVGLINVGGNVNGAQIGIINIANYVDGLQLGIINISKDTKGVPIGIISYEKQGRHDLLVQSGTRSRVGFDYKIGGDYLFSQVGVANTWNDSWSFAAGFGGHIPIEDHLWVDLDVAHNLLFNNQPVNNMLRGEARGRATLGLTIKPWFSPFIGADLNVPLWSTKRIVSDSSGVQEQISSLRQWPSLFAGVQF